MTTRMKTGVLSILLFTVVQFQAALVMAASDDLIQREIKRQIVESKNLCGTIIEVHVRERLMVLTGQVRFYEQKLISGRIAWTTPGVFEVDNEIRVIPKLSLTDVSIEQKIREIIKADEQFNASEVNISVTNGEVILIGSFLSFHDPSRLKHKVAEIEGVIDIKISSAFFTNLSGI